MYFLIQLGEHGRGYMRPIILAIAMALSALPALAEDRPIVSYLTFGGSSVTASCVAPCFVPQQYNSISYTFPPPNPHITEFVEARFFANLFYRNGPYSGSEGGFAYFYAPGDSGVFQATKSGLLVRGAALGYAPSLSTPGAPVEIFYGVGLDALLPTSHYSISIGLGAPRVMVKYITYIPEEECATNQDLCPPEPEPPQGWVPEPATWIMMIFGFGLLGLKMRRESNHFNESAYFNLIS